MADLPAAGKTGVGLVALVSWSTNVDSDHESPVPWEAGEAVW